MNSSDKLGNVTLRRTFAIISHPDAGKTTLTEQFLHYGGAIKLAGTVRARKSGRYVTSDWMKLEKERGISVTSSVMQFLYQDYVVNLLDTPGHADFSEDTYRTLTAVDSALMVVDLAKGVEERTVKLMEVCRLRDTPIMTFVNKLDREGRDPMEVMDEIESVLGIRCAPMTWPIGTGRQFFGIYRIYDDSIHLFARRGGGKEMLSEERMIKGLENSELDAAIASDATTLRDEIGCISIGCFDSCLLRFSFEWRGYAGTDRFVCAVCSSTRIANDRIPSGQKYGEFFLRVCIQGAGEHESGTS